MHAEKRRQCKIQTECHFHGSPAGKQTICRFQDRRVVTEPQILALLTIERAPTQDRLRQQFDLQLRETVEMKACCDGGFLNTSRCEGSSDNCEAFPIVAVGASRGAPRARRMVHVSAQGFEEELAAVPEALRHPS